MQDGRTTLEGILMSRSGTSSPLGKRSEDVRSKVAFPIKEAINRDVASGLLGLSESEVIDAILTKHYLGKAGMDKLHEEKMAVLFGIGQEKV